MVKIASFVYKIAIANLCWILFTLLGFILFGVAPATMALLQVTKEIKNGEEKSIFKSFLGYYVDCFPKANGYGLFLLGVNAITIGLTYLAISNALPYYMVAIILAMTLVGVFISLLVFPVYVYFEANFFNHLKLAAIITLSHPSISFVIATVLAVSYIVLFQSNLIILFPVLFLFFIFSLPAYLVHILFKPVMLKFDDEEKETDPYIQLQQ